MTKSREDVLGVLFGLLKDAAVDERVDLSPEKASETTLGSFNWIVSTRLFWPWVWKMLSI
jgi:hypothetical protein